MHALSHFWLPKVKDDLQKIRDQSESGDVLDIAQEFFCVADLPAIKATKVRATKFIKYLCDATTASCLAIAVHISARCTLLHAWLFQTQNLGLRQGDFDSKASPWFPV